MNRNQWEVENGWRRRFFVLKKVRVRNWFGNLCKKLTPGIRKLLRKAAAFLIPGVSFLHMFPSPGLGFWAENLLVVVHDPIVEDTLRRNVFVVFAKVRSPALEIEYS